MYRSDFGLVYGSCGVLGGFILEYPAIVLGILVTCQTKKRGGYQIKVCPIQRFLRAAPVKSYSCDKFCGETFMDLGLFFR